MSLNRIRGSVWNTSDNLVVDTLAQLPAADREGIIFVAGGTRPNDGLGGWFRYDPKAERSKANNDTVIDPTGTGIGRGCWIRQKYATAPGGSSFSEVHTAQAGDTIVKLTTFSYTPGEGEVAVYLNGSRLTPHSFQEISSSEIEIAQPMRLGDIIEVIKYEQPLTGKPGQTLDALQVLYDDRNAPTITATEVQTALDQLSAQVDHATGGLIPTAGNIPYSPKYPDTSLNVQAAVHWTQDQLKDHISGTGGITTRHPARSVVYDNTVSGMTAVDVQDALDELKAHLGEGQADDIEFDPAGTTPILTGINVQSAIEQLLSYAQSVEVELDGHKDILTAAHKATAISFPGADTGLPVFAQTLDVENAILQLHKQHADHVHKASEITVDNVPVNLGATGVQGVLEALRTDLDNHLGSASAHDAENIDYRPGPLGLVAQIFAAETRLQTSNVQDALDALEIIIRNHEQAGFGQAHDARQISFPTGAQGIMASTVEDALLYINQGNWRYMGHLDLTNSMPQSRSNAVNNFYTVPEAGLVDPSWIQANVFHPNGMPPAADVDPATGNPPPPDVNGNPRYEVKGDGYCFEDVNGKLWYMRMPSIQGGIVANPAPGVSQAITADQPADIPLTLVTAANKVSLQNVIPTDLDIALRLLGDGFFEGKLRVKEEVFDQHGNLRQTAAEVQFTPKANSSITVTTPSMVDTALEFLGDAHKAHVDGGANRHPASAITFTPQPGIVGVTDVQHAIEKVQNNLQTHYAPTAAAAHLGTNIKYDNQVSGLGAVNVQTALDELANQITNPPPPLAKDVLISPTATLTAQNVQAALEELDTNAREHLAFKSGTMRHRATEVSVSAVANYTGNTVQAVLASLGQGLDRHISATGTNVHTAASISFDPTNIQGVVATTVQSAMEAMASLLPSGGDIDGGTF